MLEMNMKVEYNGQSYVAKNKKGLKTLDLSRLGIVDITEIEGLDRLTDLQVLSLAGNKITEIKGLENLTNLERLNLTNNEITEIKGIDNLTKLRYFTVYKNPFHYLNMDKFGGTGGDGQYKDPQAAVRYSKYGPERWEAEEERIEVEIEDKEIETEKQTVEYQGKSYVVKNKKGLKTLDLSRLGIVDITEIEGLDRLTDLQVLSLAANRITEIKGLENLTNLERLNLTNNEITDIKGIENLTKLRYFTVYKNPFHYLNKDKFGGTGGDGQYKNPQAAVRYSKYDPERVEVVIEEDIEDEQIETEKQTVEYHGKSYVVKIKKGVKTLDLSRLGIVDITEIEGFDKLTDLQVLSLAANRITEIKGLENLTNLERLNLTNNEITEIEGIDNLIKLSYFTLYKNPFHYLNKDKFGGTGSDGRYKDPQAVVEYSRYAPERREARRIEAERIDTERRETKRLEAERVEKERIEKERQRIEAERLKAEQIERRRIEREAQRIEAERNKAERIEKKRLEAERVEKERMEKERLKAERIERERLEREAEEERIKTEATLNMKKLSIAYEEITFEKISSKTGLDIEYLENLIENLIISKEIDAVINGHTLIFRKTITESKKREIGTASKKVEIEEDIEFKQLPEIKKNFIVFVSYATIDAEPFKIKEIAKNLTNYKEIEDVLYWQENMEDNIIKYMSDSVDKCDVMLLFCSPNALKSKPIEKEWTTADIMNKPIIPIFVKPEHIPPLLKTRLGVEYDTFDHKDLKTDF